MAAQVKFFKSDGNPEALATELSRFMEENGLGLGDFEWFGGVTARTDVYFTFLAYEKKPEPVKPGIGAKDDTQQL